MEKRDHSSLNPRLERVGACRERLQRRERGFRVPRAQCREEGPPRGFIDHTLYLRLNPAHALRLRYMYCVRLMTDCFAVHCKSLQLQRDPIGTEEA